MTHCVDNGTMSIYPSKRNEHFYPLQLGLFILSLSSSMAYAWGPRAPAPKPDPAPAPAPKPTPTPKPTPPPTPTPPPPSDPGNGESASNFETYFNIGRRIDASKSRSELSKSRSPASHGTDSCTIDRANDSFAETVGWSVEQGFRIADQHLDYISFSSWDPYDIYTTGRRTPVSLLSNPLCEVDSSSLSRILSTSSRSANMPSSTTISHIQDFTKKHNTLREKALEGDTSAEFEIKKMWTTFMGCLSYVESLGDPDTQTSYNIAREQGPSDYRKPTGVKFYFDRNQPPESAINIGLYQFSPDSSGNIQGCIRKWNDLQPGCQIDRRASKSELVKVLGSSRQAFNAFCGMNQVLNTFYIQVNTDNSYRTDTSNRRSSGALKSPSDRCVSPHFRTGRSYNHFSPLHNGTGNNLNLLMSCTMGNL